MPFVTLSIGFNNVPGKLRLVLKDLFIQTKGHCQIVQKHVSTGGSVETSNWRLKSHGMRRETGVGNGKQEVPTN